MTTPHGHEGAQHSAGSSGPVQHPSDPALVQEPPAQSASDPLGYQLGPPEPGIAPVPTAPPADEERVWAVLGDVKRRGTWRVPARLIVNAVAADARIDLREAQLSAQVTTIEVRSLMAQVRIVIPENCRVECVGSAFLGEFQEKTSGPVASAPPQAPLIRVVGASTMSEVRAYRTSAAVGEGRFAIDGTTGLRSWLRRRGRSE